MTDRSDTEVDLHPEDPADLAILNMDIANADARIAERLEEYNGDAVRAFTFEWLSQNSDVLWLQRKLFDNFDDHPSSLMRVFDSIDTWTIDPDTIQDWMGKTKNCWIDEDGKYKRHHALLLCYGRNRCGLEPPGDHGLIFSGTVVWVLHDQSCVTVPEAVQHLTATAVKQREEMAVLCSIPEAAPYWVSPEDVSECNLVQLNNHVGTWATYLNRVRCYRCVTHSLQSSMRSFVALHKAISGSESTKPDTVAFYHVRPRGVLWPTSIYAVSNNDGDLLPALNVVPLDIADNMAPPPPPVPVPQRYPSPDPSLEQDVIKMMGPTVDQLEHYVVDGPTHMTTPTAPDMPVEGPRTPEGAPRPPPPDAPPRRVIIKKELEAVAPESSIGDPNVSTSLIPTGPDTEEGRGIGYHL